MSLRKSSIRSAGSSYVTFDYENRTYQIDPVLKKVYRRFVEIETSKASLILIRWRSTLPST